jgi:hypothetical protein
VTWQEELSQLDGALASGQISADDYRRERERILAMATGGSGQQNPPTPGQGAPVNRGQDAFPPPFKWTTERPAQPPQQPSQPQQPPQQPQQPPAQQQGGEERTQAVQNNAAAAENTQIVSNAADSTQIVDMTDSASKGPGPTFGDRTQFVPKVPASPPHGMPQQSPPHGMPQQQWPQQGQPQQGSWGPPQQSSPPWEDQEELVPPWAGYQAQGSELFESDAPSSGRGKVWAIVGVVVLLLVIAGGVLYLTVLKKDDSANTADKGQQQEQTSKKPPPTSKKPEPFGPLYVPEGTTSGGKTFTAAELEKSKALATPDLVLLKQAGLNEARSVVVVNESTVLSMWSFGTGDPAQLAQDITKDQKRFGFRKVPPEAQQGVDVYTSTQKSASRTVYVYRAHYTNGGNVIRVEAFDPDQAKAKAQFEAALKAQLELTAPE